MNIKSIRLHQYRNYKDEFVTLVPSISLIYGKNGQGKTNLLEALYAGSIGKSYKGMSDSDLIQWDHEEGSIIIDFMRNDVIQQIKIILSKTKKKELWVNETKMSHKEFVGTLNEVLFSPEDLQLIKGSPAMRRRFMDMEIAQVSRSYYKTLLQYNRAILQRNFLLKKIRYEKNVFLDEWDRQIASFAASIVKKRLSALRKMSLLASIIHRRLAGGTEILSMTYVQPYDKDHACRQTDPAWYYHLLKENIQKDIDHQATSIGPHRDDLSFTIGGADLKKYGSQGQQRTAVLSLKLSELEYIKSEIGEYPVLLLDDVMSELDGERRQALIDFVRNRIQTFITTTDPLIFKTMNGCYSLCIEKGKVLSYEKAKS